MPGKQRTTPRRIPSVAAALGLAILAIGATRASALDTPANQPILTVTGQIGNNDMKGAAVFDRAMLEGMDKATIQTTTPWFKDSVTFEGVPLDKVMEAVGPKGHRITVYAPNDHKAKIPLDDAVTHRAVLAYKRDGRYMAVRDKGPLFTDDDVGMWVDIVDDRADVLENRNACSLGWPHRVPRQVPDR